MGGGRWGREDGGELHAGTPNRPLAAIGADAWYQLPKCPYGWCQRGTPGRDARCQAPPHFRVGADGPRAVSTRDTATTTKYAR